MLRVTTVKATVRGERTQDTVPSGKAKASAWESWGRRLAHNNVPPSPAPAFTNRLSGDKQSLTDTAGRLQFQAGAPSDSVSIHGFNDIPANAPDQIIERTTKEVRGRDTRIITLDGGEASAR